MCYKHIVGFSKKGVHVINYRTTKIIVESPLLSSPLLFSSLLLLSQASESARKRVKDFFFR